MLGVTRPTLTVAVCDDGRRQVRILPPLNRPGSCRAGRSVAELIRDSEIIDQTIYNWRRQELIDTGQMPDVTSADQVELVAA
ncbi:hypothetical protein Van01_57090 [Micromonospora andamanensis]|uniref:Transposase n=1 Tax=Micromonospora andamanensis TaxID=1287068 RepID=A0ABQ4I3Q6_9ACTN|nr:hypothetical protein Van01_57090 [Micromonospora andamanensis]